MPDETYLPGRSAKVATDRLTVPVRSSVQMLSFYGIRVVDRNLASLERAEDWKSRCQSRRTRLLVSL